jgi:16S rRNA (adenine1518-N6/adenine1519-N6)-dimethyltransferase
MAPPRRREEGPAPPPVLKRLGQHFLTDPRILDRIVDALALEGHETVVEIGPGRGGLTDRLISRAPRIVAIEVDRKLVSLLRERFAREPSVEIVEQDALTVDFAAVARPDGEKDFVVVGNVPYYITTPLLFHALTPPRPSRSVFLVQREVAERIVAPAGSESYGALSVNVQAVAHATIVFRVGPGAFQPPPRVDSAVIRIVPLAEPVVAPNEEEPFRKLVQAAFGFRRKQMRKVVRTITGFDAVVAERVLGIAGIDPELRPEVLDAARFAALLRAIGAQGPMGDSA